MKKFGSRKFIVAAIQLLILLVLPFLYKAFDMDNALLWVVLPSSCALTGAYIGFNVWDAKNGRAD